MPKKKSGPAENSNIMAPATTVWWLIAILVLLSVAGIAGRIMFSGTDTLAGGDRLWRLSINVSTSALPNKTSIKLYPPLDTPNIRTIQRNLTYPGYKLKKQTKDQTSQRNINFVSVDKGPGYLNAEYFLHISQTPFFSVSKPVDLETETRERLLLDDESLQFKSYTVKDTLNKLLVKQPNPDLVVNEIYDFVKSLPIYLRKDALNVPQVLTQHKATPYDRSITMIALCRAAGIPARLVSGIILKDDIDPKPHFWVEVYEDNVWSSYDIYFGYKKTIPINYLPIRRNGNNIVEITNGKLNQIEYVLEPEFNHPFIRQKQKDHFLTVFDFTRLPLNIRNELALLLLLPLGALITAIFRHLVGVHSYGVFTPTLLALAIVYTNIITTLIVFVVVISLAIGGRSIFPTTLTRIPRLSIIFTLIALILTVSVSVLNYFNIDQGGKIILLPIIILTSLVDRFYNTIESKGMQIAFIRMVWTIIIATLCLPIIQFETLGNLILQYPEVHFYTLALFLLIPLYKGKHLIHLPFLKILAEPETSKKESHPF